MQIKTSIDLDVIRRIKEELSLML